MPRLTDAAGEQRPSQVLNRNRASLTVGGMLATTAALDEGRTSVCLVGQIVRVVAVFFSGRVDYGEHLRSA